MQTTDAVSSTVEAGKSKSLTSGKKEKITTMISRMYCMKKDSGKLFRYLEKNEGNCCLAISTTHAYKNRLVVYMIASIKCGCAPNDLYSAAEVRSNRVIARVLERKNLATLGKLCKDSVPLRGLITVA